MNCHDATFLLSQQRERNLTRLERLRVKIHGVVCPACARFGEHVDMLGEAARNYATIAEDDDHHSNGTAA
ncbi:zf-HC2 domain-containing protein [Novosphingobium olei]|uniref:anti-sigma factor family protein n=1 Tax=Novosphingobium olei TaxID=2728851 RepID=UPI00308D718B|nr:zf-HC2 domain-containing protein [Novosphingobium olei]